MAELAKVDLLKPINDALMIKRLAICFGLDPDVIYEKSGDWVLLWSYADKMEREYQDRQAAIQKQIDEAEKKTL